MLVRGRLHIDRVAADARAVVTVRVEDVSRADASSRVLATTDLGEHRLVAGQPFEADVELVVDEPTAVRSDDTAITAHVDVTGSGEVSPGDYVTTRHVPIPTDARDQADVPLQRVGGDADRTTGPPRPGGPPEPEPPPRKVRAMTDNQPPDEPDRDPDDDPGTGPDDGSQDRVGDGLEPERLEGDDVRTGYVTLTSGEVRPVQYAAVDGRAMFEGDIVLGTVDEMERVTARMSAPVSDDDVAHAVVISGQQYRWPNALMPYEISPSLPNASRVTDAIAHWEDRTNMRFVQRTSGNAAQYPNYVRVIPSDGCWSKVGMRGGRQDLGLASGCGTGSTIHEFGHAWGLWHEQSREDRDSFVTIHWQNIKDGKSHNFNQHISDGDDIGSYDYGSIMHYGRTAFSKNGQPTITPKQSGVSIGQRSGLSDGDIAAVHHIYRTTHHNLTVNQTYATPAAKNAWGHLSGLGWRRIDPNAQAGVTTLFAMLVHARAYAKTVHVELDGSTIYNVYL